MRTDLFRTFAPAAALLPLLALLLAAPAPVRASDCVAARACNETPRFSATVTDFRVLKSGTNKRPLSVTVRVRNKTDQPLTLVYMDGSAAAIDDRGHRYTMSHPRQQLRGLGVATAREFDPRFTLAPGEVGDTRLELSAFIDGIYGTVFDFDFSLREVESLPGNQHRLGRETVLRYTALRDGLRETAPAPAAAAPAATAAAATTEAAAPAAPVADACQGASHCVASGPLAARVERLAVEAVKDHRRGVLVTVSFRNVSAAPLVLNYKQDTGVMLDEHGQRYAVDWRQGGVQGMPVSTREKASSQFVLAPGEARRAQFRYQRHVAGTPLGRTFTPSMAVEQYELLPSNQLRLVREYALDFGPVTGAAAAASAQDLQKAIKGLGEIFKGR